MRLGIHMMVRCMIVIVEMTELMGHVDVIFFQILFGRSKDKGTVGRI